MKLNLSQIIGKKCKIFIKQNYIVIGKIYSIDNYFNFLVYDTYICKSYKNIILSDYSTLRFIRGENILVIKY